MRFLMLYPNDTSNTKVPLGIMYLLSQLKQDGHEVSIFDGSKYGIEIERNDFAIRASLLNFQDVDMEPYGVTVQKISREHLDQELARFIFEYQPDLIGVSITEDSSTTGLRFAGISKATLPNVPVIVGGVYCMTRPEKVISHPAVDMVCIAEGEASVKILAERMSTGKKIEDIANLWIKLSDGTIIKNPVGVPTDLNTLPYPDLSLIEDRHLFAPFAGHVYKMTFVESQRGCPRRCSYCCNQLFLNRYSDYSKQYLRRKGITRLIDEIVYLKDTYDLNFIQFTDDDFLLRPIDEMRIFSKLYRESVDLPFWIQAEANHLTDEKMRLLKNAGCISISMGIETGSEYIRTKVMKRKTSRDVTKRAFDIMHKYGIRTSGNVIVGVPEETRATIFETIEFVRSLEPHSLNSNIFIPYYGTAMRDYSIRKGYLDNSYHRDPKDSFRAVLDMPQISRKEVEDLSRTFALYATLPKEIWSEIEKVEKHPDENVALQGRLEEIFWEIMLKRGINVDLPGFDYDALLRKRQEELKKRKNSEEI